MKIKINNQAIGNITAMMVSLIIIFALIHFEKRDLESKNHHIDYTYADAFLIYFGRDVCVVTEIRTWEKLEDWSLMRYTREMGELIPPEAWELDNIEELLCTYAKRKHPELKGKITSESILKANEKHFEKLTNNLN